MAKIADLGVLQGDVLLFGGPYSNLQATQALFDACDRIPQTNRICTGDMVAYCADAHATASLVLEQCAAVVAGNVEIQLADGAGDCGCGFAEGSSCDVASRGWFPFASAQMTGLQAQLRALPDLVVFRHNDLRYAVVHGGASDVARFIWPTDAEAVFMEEIAVLEKRLGAVDCVIAGHSGIPFERRLTSHGWINAGVIGMPPHDGKPDGRYAISSDDDVRFHTLSYDYSSAAQAMTLAGLTQGYETALARGIWPSEDILPQTLRR